MPFHKQPRRVASHGERGAKGNRPVVAKECLNNFELREVIGALCFAPLGDRRGHLAFRADDFFPCGKVHYLACSNYRAWRICEALWTSDKHNLHKLEDLKNALIKKETVEAEEVIDVLNGAKLPKAAELY